MKTAIKQKPKLSKKRKILVMILLLLVGLSGWWAWGEFSPKPLGGDRMEYLGKEDWGGGFLYYDHRPDSTYYYGTDMTTEEITEYFKKANYTPIENSADKLMLFTLSDASFTLTYLDAHARKELPYPTSKKYIVSLLGSDYQAARKSLVD